MRRTAVSKISNAKKRILAGLLLMCLLLGSCSNKPADSSEEAAGNKASDMEVVVEPEEERPKPDLDGLDYSGKELTFIAPEWHTVRYQYTEELNGDALNDAVYNRLITVESTLNTTICWEWTGDGEQVGKVKNSVTAGDDAYQIIYNHSISGISDFVTGNYIYNLDTLPHTDFTKPWWDGNMMESFRIAKNLYYAAGDICLQSPNGILFNKTIVQNYNLPDHYELVRNGEWTYDRFIEFASSVTLDVNGDSIIDENDQTGCTGDMTERCCDIPFYCGEHLVKATDEGLELVFWSDKIVDIFEKTYSYFTNSDICNTYYRSMHVGQSFTEGLALYSLVDISSIASMRDSDVDFGIIPGFKYDEQQDKYYTYAWPLFVAVPITISDPDMTGAVMEDFCYESDEVQVAYNENLIRGKSTRDVESLEMLDIINDGLVCDIGGTYLGFDSSFHKIFYCFFEMLPAGKEDIASFYKSAEKPVKKVLDKLYKEIIKAEEKYDA